MIYQRILVAVDDSPAGLDAARAAVALAVAHGAAVRALTVVHDGTVSRSIRGDATDTEHRLDAAAHSLLRWVTELASTHGVDCDTVQRTGEPFRQILQEAETWEADLIVMGRSDRRGPSSPYLGSVTAHVLEFSDRPVLVIPIGEGGGPHR